MLPAAAGTRFVPAVRQGATKNRAARASGSEKGRRHGTAEGLGNYGEVGRRARLQKSMRFVL